MFCNTKFIEIELNLPPLINHGKVFSCQINVTLIWSNYKQLKNAVKV